MTDLLDRRSPGHHRPCQRARANLACPGSACWAAQALMIWSSSPSRLPPEQPCLRSLGGSRWCLCFADAGQQGPARSEEPPPGPVSLRELQEHLRGEGLIRRFGVLQALESPCRQILRGLPIRGCLQSSQPTSQLKSKATLEAGLLPACFWPRVREAIRLSEPRGRPAFGSSRSYRLRLVRSADLAVVLLASLRHGGPRWRFSSR